MGTAVAGAIGGLASLGSGLLGSSAADAAAESQTRAAMAASGLQYYASQDALRASKDATQQARLDAYPWAIAGAQALYKYMDELGIPRPETPILPSLSEGPMGFATEAQAQPDAPPAMGSGQSGGYSRDMGGMTDRLRDQYAAQAEPEYVLPDHLKPENITYTEGLDFEATPGYNFLVDEGEKGVVNNLSALGMANSGKALKSLTRFREGLADQEYGNYLNRLAGMAGMGQSQTDSTNKLIASGAANQGNFLMTGALRQGSALQDAGAARASGYIGSANTWGNALGGFANSMGGALGGMNNNAAYPTAPTYGVGLY